MPTFLARPGCFAFLGWPCGSVGLALAIDDLDFF